MTEPIEKWKEQFEKLFDSHTNKNHGVAYYVGIDGKYCFSDIEMAWQSFLAAKRSQPVVELPIALTLDAQFYFIELCRDIRSQGINYRTKGE